MVGYDKEGSSTAAAQATIMHLLPWSTATPTLSIQATNPSVQSLVSHAFVMTQPTTPPSDMDLTLALTLVLTLHVFLAQTKRGQQFDTRGPTTLRQLRARARFQRPSRVGRDVHQGGPFTATQGSDTHDRIDQAACAHLDLHEDS
jgi:hypothetical protein